MNYRTRHLVALTDFTHGSQFVREGEKVSVTPIDAEHYLTRRMAREDSQSPAAEVQHAAPQTSQTSSPEAAEVAAQEEQVQVTPMRRRRGMAGGQGGGDSGGSSDHSAD